MGTQHLGLLGLKTVFREGRSTSQPVGKNGLLQVLDVVVVLCLFQGVAITALGLLIVVPSVP